MKYFNILTAIALPALLLGTEIQAKTPADNPDLTVERKGASAEADDPAGNDPEVQKEAPAIAPKEPGQKPGFLQRLREKIFSQKEEDERKEKPEQKAVPSAGFFQTISKKFSNLFSQSEYKVAAMGDVEGSLDKMMTFLESNPIVMLDKNGELAFRDPKSNDKLVVMGDVVDGGPHSITILKMLTNFKNKHRQRVVLLMGNRDINKTRLNWELSDEAIEHPAGYDRTGDERGDFAGVWSEACKIWSDGAAGVKMPDPKDPAKQIDADNWGNWLAGYRKWLKDNSFIDDYDAARDLTKRKLARLVWLTKFTYGAADFFKNMKMELEKTKQIHAGENTFDFTIDYIANTYARLDGPYHDYQKAAQIIYFDEPTGTIFAHGGIYERNALGSRISNSEPMPVTTKKERDAWIKELNNSAQELIDIGATIDGVDSDENKAKIKQASEIVAYQEPIGKPEKGKPFGTTNNDRSVVVGRPWFTDNGVFAFTIEKRVPMKELASVGIFRIVTGHTPGGEVPVLVRSKELYGTLGFRKYFEVIDTDTTYASRPNVAAVVVGTKSGVAIMAVFRTSKESNVNIVVTYSTKTDKDLGRQSLVKYRIKNAKGEIEMKELPSTNLGRTQAGDRLKVSHYPDHNFPQYLIEAN